MIVAHPELLTPAEMAEADRLAIAGGTPGAVLMEAAGRAVADEALKLAGGEGPRAARVAVLCGPGNNGGDGFVAARILAERGCDVSLALLGAREALRGDAAGAARSWTGAVAPLDGFAFEDADVVIDALFGAGLSRALDGVAAATVARLNRWSQSTDRPVLAVDVPSGLDGATGASNGEVVRAARTVTFFRLKPGHLLLPGRALCGEVVLADIGIPASVLKVVAPRTWANIPAFWGAALPIPSVAGHKYARGHAVVLSGPMPRIGAARLAARAALRAGAGLVTLASPCDALPVHLAALDAVMVDLCDRPADLDRLLLDPRKSVLALGPGLGTDARARAFVELALAPESRAGGRSLVLDADALTAFSGDAVGLTQRVRAAAAPVVLTPHEGEFSRLFINIYGKLNVSDQALESVSQLEQALASPSKLARARAAARLTGAVVALKGADTVVAHPDGRAVIGCDLPPWLATAGSGDVLGGLIAGLLAQDMPVFEAASAAVWLHGAAARAFGPGLTAEDIAPALPAVFAALWRDLGRMPAI
jgi:hydroxyethylthiazole kinase-like uncharacterized protein yjeF